MSWRTGALGALVFSVLASSAACAQILGFDKGYTETGGSSASSSTTNGPGSGGMASTGGSGGGGTGGSGVPVPCKADADCTGLNTECAQYTCQDSLCIAANSPSGTAVAAQTTGNCQKTVCDGHGNLTLQVDDSNIPDDSNPCTKDICASGKPSNPAEPVGVKCGASLTCDGQGHCAGCTGPSDCPGTENECQSRSCTGSLCGFIYTAAGTPVMAQTAGDCKKSVCNGMGAVSLILDPTDAPASTNPCVSTGCSMGSPTQSNTAQGAACTTDPGTTVCDGDGNCVQCLQPSTCPGQDTECHTRACTAGACGFGDQMSGTQVSTQTPGDCETKVCDGQGGVTSQPDNTDIPTNGTTCDTASCNNGKPVLTPVASGTTCGPMKTCDGTGNCVGCTGAADCPGMDTECQARTCSGTGVCGFTYQPSGTATSAQTAGDCKKNVCNGSGGISTIADDSDVPTANQCYTGVCSSGVPSNPPAAAGTACGTGVCNGAGLCGVCVPGAFRACCGVKSMACCDIEQQLHLGPPCDPEEQTCLPAITGPLCCCDTEQDCNANGQWGACF
jgi:hypothetical protein